MDGVSEVESAGDFAVLLGLPFGKRDI